jgi:hypothetical protein
MFYGCCHKGTERVPGEWDDQHHEIVKLIQDASPDILLIEGALDFHPESAHYLQSVEEFRATSDEEILARNHEGLRVAKAFPELPFECAEPSAKEELACVASALSELDFAFFYIVRDMRGRGSFETSVDVFKERFNRPDLDVDQIKACSVEMTGVPFEALDGLDIDEFNRMFAPTEYVHPSEKRKTNTVSDVSTKFRNQNIRNRIKYHVGQGKHVFVIFGSSHSQPVRKPLKLDDGWINQS